MAMCAYCTLPELHLAFFNNIIKQELKETALSEVDERRVSECSFHGFKNTSKHNFCSRRGETVLKEKHWQLVKLMTMGEILVNASQRINHTDSQPHHMAIPLTSRQTAAHTAQDPKIPEFLENRFSLNFCDRWS